jgi:uncharacterized FlaG/YvyC family protein
MQISSDLASQQLSAIVNGPSAPKAPAPQQQEVTKTAAPAEAPSLSTSENQAYYIAKQQGQEKAYLQEEVEVINQLTNDMSIPLNFSVEISDKGDYFIRILDEAGKEVKVIPSEKFVQTRDKIYAEIKGLIEDSAT